MEIDDLAGGEDVVHEGASSEEVVHDCAFAQDGSFVIDCVAGL